MTDLQWLAVSISGWAVALALLSLWWGERRSRIFIEHYTTFGGRPLRKAKVYDPPDEEDRIDEVLDKIEA